jgi:hypothetical protein
MLEQELICRLPRDEARLPQSGRLGEYILDNGVQFLHRTIFEFLRTDDEMQNLLRLHLPQHWKD